jgi:hypothetical protein
VLPGVGGVGVSGVSAACKGTGAIHEEMPRAAAPAASLPMNLRREEENADVGCFIAWWFYAV